MPIPLQCPFKYTADYGHANCSQELCQLWDLESENCSARNDRVESRLAAVEGELTLIKTILTHSDEELTESREIASHVHLQHRHPKGHNTGELEETLGDWFEKIAPAQKLAETLLGELMNGQDLDGNGLIFGRDFKVVGVGVPFLIQSAENMATFISDAPSITWTDAMIGDFSRLKD